MNDTDEKATAKRAYEKPLLRKLALRADEVLVAGCKTASGGAGPISGACTTGGAPGGAGPCRLPGS